MAHMCKNDIIFYGESQNILAVQTILNLSATNPSGCKPLGCEAISGCIFDIDVSEDSITVYTKWSPKDAIDMCMLLAAQHKLRVLMTYEETGSYEYGEFEFDGNMAPRYRFVDQTYWQKELTVDTGEDLIEILEQRLSREPWAEYHWEEPKPMPESGIHLMVERQSLINPEYKWFQVIPLKNFFSESGSQSFVSCTPEEAILFHIYGVLPSDLPEALNPNCIHVASANIDVVAYNFCDWCNDILAQVRTSVETQIQPTKDISEISAADSGFDSDSAVIAIEQEQLRSFSDQELIGELRRRNYAIVNIWTVTDGKVALFQFNKHNNANFELEDSELLSIVEDAMSCDGAITLINDEIYDFIKERFNAEEENKNG